MIETLSGSIVAGSLTLNGLIFCTIVSLVLGLAVAGIYRFRGNYSLTLSKTLVLLPAMVQIIIMLVDGNIGVGIAVAGAFSLIRFRSIAGNANDIAHLFFAMSLGFITGLGYLFYALIFFILVGGASLLLSIFQNEKTDENMRMLRIMIPENLDYEGIFDDIFKQHTDSAELEAVKTTQMGSLYELTYTVKLKELSQSRTLIDDLRIRNGNLSVTLSRVKNEKYEL